MNDRPLSRMMPGIFGGHLSPVIHVISILIIIIAHVVAAILVFNLNVGFKFTVLKVDNFF